MLKRKIDTFLKTFYERNNKALLLTGARQVGKSFSIREYGSKNYESYIEINFITTPSAKNIFKDVQSTKEAILRLSAFADKPLVKGSTFIFFDEVQECPEAVTYIKFLVEEGSYRYALSGSLLGVEMTDLRSAPVGYMSIKEVYPLDLEEFMMATSINNQIIEHVKESWQSKKSVDSVIHDKLMSVFRLYLLIGGMPESVNTYLATNDFNEVITTQKSIINLYKMDISKYDKRNKIKISDIFDLIPPELNAKNKRFILKNLNQNAKFNSVEDLFLWLKYAGVALPVYNVEEPKEPLILSRSRNLFKLFQNDVGLLAAQYADGIQFRVLSGDSDINYGAIYENAVAQELHAHGFPLYYYNSKKQGELDFIVDSEGYVLPIEVKSGKSYDRHRALNNIMDNPAYTIPNALVLCNDNLYVEDKILYAPIYMMMCLQKK